MECCNFINNQLTPESHPLFATENRFHVIKLMEDNETADVRIKFQRSVLLPGVTFKSVNLGLPVLEQNIKARQYLHMMLILQHCYQSLEK